MKGISYWIIATLKRMMLIIACMLYCIICVAQTIINPVFDRMDTPAFRVEKVEMTPDTTYVHCLYRAEDHSWANISKNTRIEDVSNGTRFPILKVSGIPFSPEKRNFEDSTMVNVILYFPHINTEKINIIENEDNESFNIYGINLKEKYETIYTDDDIAFYFNTAKSYENKEKWKLAINSFTKQLDASKFVYGLRSKECSYALFNLLLDYYELKEYEKCIELGQDVIDILGEVPQDSLVIDVLARTYGSISTIYYSLKQYEMATQYKEMSTSMRKKKEGVRAVPYEQYLKDATLSYYYNEDFPKALLYGKELVNVMEKKYKEDGIKYGFDYINALCNLCEFYQRMSCYEEAVESGKQALKLVEEGVCRDVVWLKYNIYNNLAGAVLNLGQVNEAIGYLKMITESQEAKEVAGLRLLLNSKMFLSDILLKNKIKKDTLYAINEYESILKIYQDSIKAGASLYFPEYPEVLNKLYNVYKGNNDSLSIKYLEQLIQYVKDGNGENSIAYANLVIQYISNVFIKRLQEKKELDSLIVLLRNSSDVIKRHINNSVFNMSKNERQLYWQRYKRVFTWLIPTICGMTDIDSANSLAYDASLFYKGMLLSSEREFRDIVLSSQDSTLNSLYSSYLNNLSLLEKQYTHGSSSLNIDSLKKIIKDDEYLMSQKVSSYNRLYKGTNYSWEEVRDHLSDGDVAIEIVSYDNLDGSNTYYEAYIINNKSKSPQCTVLFDENYLKEVIREDSLEYALSMFIWGNEVIYDAIKDAKTIYFSASGILNTIGIEYLPISGGRFINERFNIIRLSSTRELCLSNNKPSINDVYLFGGLDYDNMNQEGSYNKTDTTQLSRSVVDSIVKRGGFESLVGSKEEIEQVKNEMLNKSVNCHTFTGSDGTETTFLGLSGKIVDILHLSTHGMYVPVGDSITHKQFNGFIISDKSTDIAEEDQSLTHSFLVMSGGNKLLHDNNKQKQIDDGILTALEVSHLDFSNLDLVVLSACQTALGSIEPEGVYGLQRGFKKAGARTILMSLDKVDDEATKILMVEFYRNLMSGKTKQQSLKDAQRHLRKINNGKYDKPEYWASFIMLDGLN